MKKILFLLIGISILFSFASFGKEEKKVEQKGYIPQEGFIPNEETAIKIAEAVLVPIYGERVLEKKPFIVKLENGVWYIKGTLPKGYLGGVPYIQIQKDDGKILMVGHSK